MTKAGRGGRRKGAGRPPLEPKDRLDDCKVRLNARHRAILERMLEERARYNPANPLTRSDAIRLLIELEGDQLGL